MKREGDKHYTSLKKNGEKGVPISGASVKVT
jgi:hypothetical protein